MPSRNWSDQFYNRHDATLLATFNLFASLPTAIALTFV